MTDKTIYFTRHAQAEHNVAEDYTIRDAPLTKLGRQQSAELREDTEELFQKEAELLVSSPRLEAEGKPVILLPELQEVNDLPCDTGSDRSFLESDPEFSGLDFTPLSDSPAHHNGASWTSKQGFFAPENVEERARWVRRWLRERKEKKIVVVAHGDILRCITDGYRSATPWANAEVRAYTFSSADDDDAKVISVKEVAKEGGNAPTSSDLQNGRNRTY
ncbi:phosphoglycerate mutase family protein [Rhodotorula toruloides]|nr:phosphoglycerate mutase family protein [Rhodotorula toruloides]